MNSAIFDSISSIPELDRKPSKTLENLSLANADTTSTYMSNIPLKSDSPENISPSRVETPKLKSCVSSAMKIRKSKTAPETSLIHDLKIVEEGIKNNGGKLKSISFKSPF
jgi:hypothetical protein